MRCPDCAKMVSYDMDNEPQDIDLEVSEDGQVQGSCTVTLNCADCGTELKSGSVEFDASCEEATKHIAGLKAEEVKDHKLEIEDGGGEQDSRQDKPGRYGRTFYIGRVQYEVKCSCGETFEGEVEGEIQASSMDELV